MGRIFLLSGGWMYKKTSLSILVGGTFVCEKCEVSLENCKMLRGEWAYWRRENLWCLIYSRL